MEVKDAQKIAYAVNTVMMSMIFGFLIFFIKLGAPFLIWFSIPIAVVYTLEYFLIRSGLLNIYLWICYAGLLIYTGVTAICLGSHYGFQLYCFSMIPCVYSVEYMSFKLGRSGVKSFNISMIVALFYLAIIGWLTHFGPVYKRDRFSTFFLIFNSITVFSYLVIYTNYLIRNIIKSETKLTEMAHIDRLTGLYNRHYMLNKLSKLPEGSADGVLAIADIDDFKKINDTYGHNAGDEVLRVISEKMRTSCKDCNIARWGGEEFLILCPKGESEAMSLLEGMRVDIGSVPVEFEGSSIKVTITIGMSKRQNGESIDEWIHQIDKMLYIGKKNGKNRVVHELEPPKQ